MYEYYSKAEPNRFGNKSTQRGTDLEDSAAFKYSVETGIEIQKVGFVIMNDYVGASPDGFENVDGMVEIKCREDRAYWDILRGGKIDSSELWQSQMGMIICEKKYCVCIDYNPNFKKSLIIRTVEPDQKMVDDLYEGFELGSKLIQQIQEEMDPTLK